MNSHLAGIKLKDCTQCGGYEYPAKSCKPKWEYMKATGARNKVGCWRPKGVILVWGEEQCRDKRTS